MTASAAGRRPGAPPSLHGPIPFSFCATGTIVAVVGALPWLARLATDDRGLTWPLLALGAVAFVVGVFVLLVGVGLFRARNAVRATAAHANAEAALDAELAATVARAGSEGCADGPSACASCTASCSLGALRH